jgi:predicted DNA-binding transcriptional regulator AlpA
MHDNIILPDRRNARGLDMMIEVSPKKPGVSIPELSAEFGVSEAVLYHLANSGQLPGARRLGKRIVVHRETFERWMQEGQGA